MKLLDVRPQNRRFPKITLILQNLKGFDSKGVHLEIMHCSWICGNTA
jgi:hypothetical protein